MSLDYERARAAAAKELEKQFQVRQKTEQRILQLKATIKALDALSSRTTKDKAIQELGLTDAIRSLFKARPPDAILTAKDVRRHLHETGFDRSKYSNFLASIHVVLHRLKDQGEIVPAENGGFRRKETDEEWLS